MKKILIILLGCLHLFFSNFLHSNHTTYLAMDEKYKPDPAISARVHFYLSMASAQIHTSEAFAWFTGIPNSFFNSVLYFSYKDNIVKNIDTLLANAPFEAPLSFFIYSFNKDLIPILKERGFRSVGQFQAMHWDVQSISSSTENLEIKPAGVKEFLSILTIAYAIKADVAEQFAVLLDKSDATENYLAYRFGKPIATGSLFIHEKEGLVLHIATFPAHQKQGVGRTMMHALMHRAFVLGLKQLVLYCPSHVEGFYSSLGFTRGDAFEIFELPKNPSYNT